MTLLLMVSLVLALLMASVAWTVWRLFRSVSRYDDWDQPIAARKRRSWK